MDIDFQELNLLVALLRLLAGAGAFALIIWIAMDLVKWIRRKALKSFSKTVFWTRFVWKVFFLIVVAAFIFTAQSNAPKLTLDYQDRKATPPQGEVTSEGGWREGWEEREKHMRDLDAETKERTSADD